MKWVVFVLAFIVFAVVVANEQKNKHEIPASTTASTDIEELRSPATQSADTLTAPPPAPTEMTVLKDVAYGDGERMVFDAYTFSDGKSDKPLIIMVHGGAWALGDKSNANSIENKVEYWVPRGYVVVSINYPLLPNPPDEQARSVAQAITYIQENAHTLGVDTNNITLMGHSAGAHLVALVSSQKAQYPELAPWRRSVVIDTEALDVEAVMEDSPSRLFINAFGTDEAYWETVSPIAVLSTTTEPMLIVCSSFRSGVCDIAEAYQATAATFGTDVTVLSELKTHAQTNKELGLENSYTQTVYSFLK